MAAELPPRRAKISFPDSVDLPDTPTPSSYFKAQQHYKREKLIGWKGYAYVQAEFKKCVASNPVVYGKACKELALEYMRMMNCPDKICPDDPYVNLEWDAERVDKYKLPGHGDVNEMHKEFLEPYWADVYKYE